MTPVPRGRPGAGSPGAERLLGSPPVNRKSISTNMSVVACDVCGRTLLRGEHADVFLHGGARRTVCELCTSRAVHEGWIREGLDAGTGARSGDRRSARSLLGSLRRRRGGRGDEDFAPPAPGPARHTAPAEPEYDPATWDPEHYDPAAPVARPAAVDPAVAPPAAAPAPSVPRAPAAAEDDQLPRPREPRQVHAVPTNAELKVARALEVFNASPHRRTVAGVARSLGAPIVAASPSATEGSIVAITVAWELSWYRYEVDLADEASGVRVVAQGTELDELADAERTANAHADEQGELHPAAAAE